ncbi:MAG: tetratricopeptide repeat protein [Oligoflexales bacterium]
MTNKDLRILILSSDSANIQTLVKILAQLGYLNIIVKEDGLTISSWIKENPFGFLICDMSIKNISGWTLIRELKASPDIPNFPNILAGSEPAPAGEEELKSYGVVKYLLTPFNEKNLKFLINSTILLFNSSGTIENKFTHAKDALIAQKSHEAIEKYEELNNLTDRGERSSIGLYQAHVKSDNMSKAIEAINSINPKRELSPSALIVKIKILADQRKINEAIELAQILLEEKMPRVPYFYQKSLNIFMNLNEFKFSKKICQLAIEKEFKVEDFYLSLARIEYQTEDFNNTLEILDKAETIFGQTSELYNLRGVCYKKKGLLDTAKSCYERAIELAPQDSKLYFNISSCAIAMKSYDEAKQYLEQCLKIEPKFEKAQEKIDEIDNYLTSNS